MENILVNPGHKEEKFVITTFLFPEDKWTKEASEKWIQRRYRNYEYLGKIAGYYQYRVLPKTHIKELEKKSKEIRGEVGYRVFTFPTRKNIKALLLVLAPPVSETEELKSLAEISADEGVVLENPVRKVTPEIEEEVKRLWKEGYKVIQIRGIIKDKFGVSISAPTVRNIIKNIPRGKQIEDLSNLEGGENMEEIGALPSELMKKAMELLKEGKFKSKSEALKWAHKVKKGEISEPEYQRIVSEILINKGGKMKSKKTTIPAGLQRTLSKLTKAVEMLSNPAKKRKKRPKEKAPENTIKRAIQETLTKLWNEDPVFLAIKSRMAKVYPDIIKDVWEKTPKMREELSSAIQTAWLTEPGKKLKKYLSEEIKAARKEAGLDVGMFEEEDVGYLDLSGLDRIERLATAVLFDEIGLGQLIPIPGGKTFREKMEKAWETPEGRELIKKIKSAWHETTEGKRMKEILSGILKEARAEVIKKSEEATVSTIEAFETINEAIEALKQFKKKEEDPTHSEIVQKHVRSAWARLTPDERDELKRSLREAIYKAWASTTGSNFRDLLKKRLESFWLSPVPSPISSMEAIEQWFTIPDIPKIFGLDYLIPGTIATFGEALAHTVLEKIVAIPFGKPEDIEKVYWKKALCSLLAGGIHYALINYLFNKFGRGEFLQKIRVMYSAYIIRDVVKGFIPEGFIKQLQAKTQQQQTKPTGEIEETVEYAVLPIDQLNVTETGEFEVPVEVYEKLVRESAILTGRERIRPTEEEIIPSVSYEQISPEEIEPKVSVEEEEEEESYLTQDFGFEVETEEGLAENENI